MNLDGLSPNKVGVDVLFIDDGGVLNDNRLRRPQCTQLVGQFMPSRLDGTSEEWRSANEVAHPPFQRATYDRLIDFSTHAAFQREYEVGWMKAMCAHVGIDPPPENTAISLHRELTQFMWRNVDAAIPGAVAAVHTLHAAGYVLHMASGGPSWELATIVERMGIASAFGTLYGADLIDHVKHGPTYYERVFSHAGIDPATALVIESDAECCDWARQAGARAVHVDRDGAGDFTALAALVRALA